MITIDYYFIIDPSLTVTIIFLITEFYIVLPILAEYTVIPQKFKSPHPRTFNFEIEYSIIRIFYI